MKIEIHISEDRTSYTLAIDGGPAVPLDEFVLLTKEGERTRNIVFGPVEVIGRLLYGFYVNCWKFGQRGMRDILEEVAEDIRDAQAQRTIEAENVIRRLM